MEKNEKGNCINKYNLEWLKMELMLHFCQVQSLFTGNNSTHFRVFYWYI